MADRRHEKIKKSVDKSLMKIIMALYESKLVKGINLNDVYKLYGFAGPNMPDSWIDFKDPNFTELYREYNSNPDGFKLSDTPESILKQVPTNKSTPKTQTWR